MIRGARRTHTFVCMDLVWALIIHIHKFTADTHSAHTDGAPPPLPGPALTARSQTAISRVRIRGARACH